MKIFAAGLLFILCTGAGIAETRDAEKYFFDLKMGDFKSELPLPKRKARPAS